MLVKPLEFDAVVERLSSPGERALDTETTGLRPYQGDRLFAVVIADDEGVYYFDFNGTLPREWLPRLRPIFDQPESLWFIHNAKFDLAMLAQEGLELAGRVHCTMAIARVERNDHLAYGLDDCAERIGLKKDDAVEAYINTHSLWEWVEIPGKKKRDKKKFFDRVPLHVMQPYAEQDALVTHALGYQQLDELEKAALSTPVNLKSVKDIYALETELTKTCFQMERIGVAIDGPYCRNAASWEAENYQSAAREFEKISGVPFVDSNKQLATAFSLLGETYPVTEKGNPSFTDEVLAGFNSPIAVSIQNYRDAYKKANTYYRNFLYYADDKNVVHANIRQGGTATGRFSYSDPNLQNLNKEDDLEAPYLVRRAFIPRPGYVFVMIDYDQMEYRLMLDYARELPVIAKILLEGLDVHEATAQMMGVTRNQAKTLNFMLLYGGGAQKLARALGVSLSDAKALKARYFSALPCIEAWIRQVVRTAEHRGYVFNWAGRRCYFKDPNFAYTAPNHLIQGGCADVVKIAMNRLAERLKGMRSRMLVQIHDEILFEIHETELTIVPELKAIMESVYPHRHIKLTCGVEWSRKSWADKEAFGEETGDCIQGASGPGPEKDPRHLVRENPAGGDPGHPGLPDLSGGQVHSAGA